MPPPPYEKLGAPPTTAELEAAMIGIGMRFVGEPDNAADIERTLVWASLLGVEQHDNRVLGVLCVWLDVHSSVINTRRLCDFLSELAPYPTTRAFWAAVGTWLGKTDARFHALERIYVGPRVSLANDLADAEFLISRHGEDPRFAGGPIRVHAKLLRDRPGDVTPPEQLSRRHAEYRRRLGTIATRPP